MHCSSPVHPLAPIFYSMSILCYPTALLVLRPPSPSREETQSPDEGRTELELESIRHSSPLPPVSILPPSLPCRSSDRCTSLRSEMWNTYRVLAAAQIIQVERSGKGGLFVERIEVEGDPRHRCSSFLGMACKKQTKQQNGTDFPPDEALKTVILNAVWLCSIGQKKSQILRSFVDSWHGPGFVTGLSGLWMWIRMLMGRTWASGHCCSNRSMWTCLVSQRSQSCLGECVHWFLHLRSPSMAKRNIYSRWSLDIWRISEVPRRLNGPCHLKSFKTFRHIKPDVRTRWISMGFLPICCTFIRRWKLGYYQKRWAVIVKRMGSKLRQ